MAAYLPSRVEDDTAFQFSFLWCFAVPLAFYMCWQLLYFIIVQAGLSSLLTHAYVLLCKGEYCSWLLMLTTALQGICCLLTTMLRQVVFRQFIISNGYDTSYKCLARRAVKSNNFWNRTVRKGSILRRVFMFGMASHLLDVLISNLPETHSALLILEMPIR